MTDAYIIDAARTPRGIGKLGKGSLSEFHPGRLLAKVFEGIELVGHVLVNLLKIFVMVLLYMVPFGLIF